MKTRFGALFAVATLAAAALSACSSPETSAAKLGAQTQAATAVTYDLNTLAGKVASVNGTAGLQIHMSALIESDADTDPSIALLTDGAPADAAGALLDSPDFISPLAVTVNLDTNSAPQNETSIAVDPNNPSRVVASANDYVTGTWSCFINGVPCSAYGDGYSGTYFSNDSGKTWCCNSSDPAHIGTLIPGVDTLVGGSYGGGGDPAVSFDSSGTVYYAGLGFNRATPPNTVAVNRGTFDASGALAWSPPTFINATTSPATFNDKEWIVADSGATSPFRDRVYVTWTRFLFNPVKGRYVQSPIFFAYSTDGARTFTQPQLISAPVLYSQGSRPVVGPDGALYVFWDGSTRLATTDSIWCVKSTDGGASFGAPIKVADVADISGIADTKFRVNSFPAAGVASNGDIYAAWSASVSDATAAPCADSRAAGCHSAALLSKSTDGGATWSAAVPVNPALDASHRTPVGYAGVSLVPDVRRVDTFWPAVATTPSGKVYISYYAADEVSPWKLSSGTLINNARLDDYATSATGGASNKLTTNSINTRYQFGGGFIGDYTGIAAGSDDVFHTLFTATYNKQATHWWFGRDLSAIRPPNYQQDVFTVAGRF